MTANLEAIECIETERAVAQLFPVLCAWCEREGRETVIGWIAVPGSHGICKAHGDIMRAEAGL